MKVASKLAILLSLGTFGSFASAKSLEQTYLDNCRKDSNVPVPIIVVSPQVDSALVGETVEVEFTVSTAGKPSNVSVLSSKDAALSDAVVTAVKQWQFKPAQKDGAPVATKVILPVRVVDTDSNRFAAN
jgi:TonB family protein